MPGTRPRSTTKVPYEVLNPLHDRSLSLLGTISQEVPTSTQTASVSGAVCRCFPWGSRAKYHWQSSVLAILMRLQIWRSITLR